MPPRAACPLGKVGIVKRLRTVATLAFGYLLVLLAVPGRAQAYLDPGTGSYLIQVLLAALLAVGVTVKVYWRSISGFFRRRFAGNREPADGAADER